VSKKRLFYLTFTQFMLDTCPHSDFGNDLLSVIFGQVAHVTIPRHGALVSLVGKSVDSVSNCAPSDYSL
jgi:hypothetical protein